ncbi:MAG: ABC transporter transmembrane domain-containing protein, partial [Anaerolineae bacterium]
MRELRRLVTFLRPYRWHMIIVTMAAAGLTMMNLVNPWLVRELIQVIRTETGNSALDHVISLALLLLGVFAGRAIFRFLYSYVAHVMAYSFVDDLRVALYNHIQHLSVRFFEDRQTGELLKRIITDTRDIEPLIAHYIPDMSVNFLLLIGVGAILFRLNPLLTLLTLLPMPFLLFSTLYLGQRMHRSIKDASQRLGLLTGVVQDNLVGIREIQLFTQEGREHQRINTFSSDTTRTHLHGMKMQAILSPSVEFLTGIGLVTVVLFGGQAVLRGTMAVEDLVAFILYLTIFYQPITIMGQMNELLHVALNGA